MFRHRIVHYLLLAGVVALLMLPNLGGPSLWDLDEGKNARCAEEMLQSGNWIVPTFNGSLRSDKPVLLYWLQMLTYAMFGVNEFAARLPSALASLITVLTIYELGRRMFSAITGLIAGLMLPSTILFCAAGHFANPDALLCACTAANLYFIWLGMARKGRPMYALAGATSGLAVLAKGPVGVVLPTLVFGLFLLWTGRLRVLLDRRWAWAVLTWSLVALPWYIWVAADTKFQFWYEFFLTHNRDRALTTLENHSGTPAYYLIVLLVGFAPWSIFLGLGFWYGGLAAIRRPWRWLPFGTATVSERESAPLPDGRGSESHVDAYRFLWCWIAVYFVLFSIAATKLPNYVLPIYPPVALLTARFLDRWRCGAIQPSPWLLHACLAGLVGIGALTAGGLMLIGGSFSLPILRGRVYDGLALWAVLGAVPLAGALAAWYQLQRAARGRLIACIAITALVFLAPLAAIAGALNGYKAPRELVREADALQPTEEIRIGCYHLEYLPSLNFYVKRPVQHLATETDAIAFLDYPLPVFLFVPAPEWEHLRPQVAGTHREVARRRDLYRNVEIVVVSNR